MKKLFVFLALLLALGMTCVLAEGAADQYEYDILDDGSIILTNYIGSAHQLVLPDTLDGYKVTGISDSMFYGNETVQNVTIPNQITYVEGNPFAYVPLLTEIIVAPDHPTLKMVDGVLFSKDGTRLINYPYTRPGSSYDVPQGTVIIGESAFSDAPVLTKITLPDTITTIERYAFYWCDHLAEINIPEGVTNIDNRTFAYNTALTTIALPDSVVTLEDNPFIGCSSLSEIKVSPEHPTLAVIDGVLYEKKEQRLVCYPPAHEKETLVVPDGIRVIGEESLNDAPLSSIILPDTVTTIENGAFMWCSQLKEINIPQGVTKIDGYTFYFCNSLPSITIPDTVTSIGYYAFAYCDALTEVVIPESVTLIRSNAFSECDNLTSIIVPASVTEIEEDAFYECAKLTLTVTPGSYAAQYAKDNNIPYIYADNAWDCTCGAINTTNFCPDCGTARPVDPTCANCGYDPEGDTPNYCPDCGTKF